MSDQQAASVVSSTGRYQRMLEPTIPVEFVVDALQSCLYRGIDTADLLEQAGLEQNMLDVQGYRVSAVSYSKLVELIIKTLDDGFVGFLDAKIPVRAFSVFACQLAACTNVLQVVQQANRFYGLFTDQFKIVIKEHNDEVILALEFRETQSFDYRFIYQSALVVLLRLIDWFVGENTKPKLVGFSFEAAGMQKYLEYLFDCPLAYSCQRNEIHIEKQLLTTACSVTLEQVDAMLRDSAIMMLVSTRPAPFTHQVRKALVIRRQDCWPSADEIANSMGISTNLLWRKLKKEGASFLGIRDGVKRDLAISLLCDNNLTVAEVSSRVGFAELSAFNKAFKKWTSQTPSSYRASL